MDFISFSIICVKVLLVFAITMLTILIMIYAESRVSAFMQGRLGPNRVGPQGLLQPIADGIKFLMKEDIIPAGVDKPIYLLAPAMLLIPALMTFAIIPFGSDITMFGRNIPLQVADINVGILYILALTSIGVYGLVLAGWSSNSKYPLIGGLRSSAQLISYELAMGLAIVSIVLLAGSLRLNDIISQQQGHFLSWNVFKQPLAYIIFLTAWYALTRPCLFFNFPAVFITSRWPRCTPSKFPIAIEPPLCCFKSPLKCLYTRMKAESVSLVLCGQVQRLTVCPSN